MTPGASGNLAHFRRIEVPELVSVELPLLSEGDVIDVEIEPHADRIRGDEIFDVPLLIKTDLGIAGARAERAENNGGSTALAADQFRDRIDLVRREGDDGRALRQARDLLLARLETSGTASRRERGGREG